MLFQVFFFVLFFYSPFSVLEADAAIPWQFGLQDPSTPVMQGILKFHHDLMVVLIFVCVFVIYVMCRSVQHFHYKINAYPNGVVHGTVIEIIWTIVPAVILMFIAIPSFALLYSVDEFVDPAVTLKIVGHQWYWSYEYSDYFFNKDLQGISFDSYMLSDDMLVEGTLRLLEVDNRLVLPVDTHIRVVVTAADVLHCWTVPSFGLKVDACPGRLNQASLFITREGVYFGQCSEICGVNHGFMPIAVEVVDLKSYLLWVFNNFDSNEL